MRKLNCTIIVILLMKEKHNDSNVNGYSKWKLAVPKGIKIDFNSVVSGLTVEGEKLNRGNEALNITRGHEFIEWQITH